MRGHLEDTCTCLCNEQSFLGIPPATSEKNETEIKATHLEPKQADKQPRSKKNTTHEREKCQRTVVEAKNITTQAL